MQHERGTGDAPPEQVKFAKVWLQGVIDDSGVSVSALARKSEVHRNNISDWLNLRTFPQPATLRRFCDNLNLDYSVPARILGWAAGEPDEESPSEAWNKKVRAEAMMRNLERRGRLTPERKAKYEAMIRMAERSYAANMDAFFEEAERDLAEDSTPDDVGE